MDKKAVEPKKQGNGDDFEIGVKSQTGNPGPLTVGSENFLVKKDEANEEPANTGGPLPVPLVGNLDPPPVAPIGPSIAPNLVICYVPQGGGGSSGGGGSGGGGGVTCIGSS